MRIELSLAALLLPMMLSAQENVKVKGRIINRQGEAVEYVQVGVPGLRIGTISTVDGRFEIDIPCDTLEFFHVSYQPVAYPVTGPVDDAVIVLREQELPPAVFIGGDTKEKYLLRPGMNVLKNMGVVSTALRSEHPSGRELGSIEPYSRLRRFHQCLPHRGQEGIICERTASTHLLRCARIERAAGF